MKVRPWGKPYRWQDQVIDAAAWLLIPAVVLLARRLWTR